MTTRMGPILVLLLMGAGWGLTQPLSKLAVSGGYRAFGLIFWQLVIAAVVLGAVTKLRGKSLPFKARHLQLYLVIALVGTLMPNTASYKAIQHLPSGVVSVLLSLVPMFAFPVALLFGVDRFSWLRLLGLCFGLLGVLLIIGPEASLPERAMLIFIPLALVAPVFYGLEGNIVAKWGTAGLDPIQVLYGASLMGAFIAFPLAVLSGQWIDPRPPYGVPDYALALSSVIHAIVYTTYVWLVGRTGPTFAVQVAYLVTGFGVIWAMLVLGESYSGYLWLAMGMMFVGIFLVQPRDNNELVSETPTGKDASQ